MTHRAPRVHVPHFPSARGRSTPIALLGLPIRARFTLIELLVVVAIIAVLASLLLPALGRARAKAIEISCLSQMKQMGTAMKVYEDDHEVIFSWQIGEHPMNPCLYNHTTHGNSAARDSHARNPGSGLYYSHLGNIRWYGPGFLIRWGYVPGYEAMKATGSHHGQLFWCPGFSPGYQASLESVSYAWNNNQNQWSPAAWKAWFWNTSYTGAGRGAQTNYIFDYVTREDVSRDAAAVPVMWDMDFTRRLSTNYWAASQGEIHAQWNSLHPSGYNVLYYDGHAKMFADGGQKTAIDNRGQGINGLNNTSGLTGYTMRQRFMENY